MAISLKATLDPAELRALNHRRTTRALVRAMRKAGSTALRDMRSEASKRVRKRKRLKVKEVKKALSIQRARGKSLDGLEWRLNVSGKRVPLSAYPHRQTKRGVSVSVNRGKRTVVAGAFVSTMKSGHRGVFKRRGRGRLPIRELLGSRPVDALLHDGEALGVATRGERSFRRSLDRLLAQELGRG